MPIQTQHCYNSLVLRSQPVLLNNAHGGAREKAATQKTVWTFTVCDERLRYRNSCSWGCYLAVHAVKGEAPADTRQLLKVQVGQQWRIQSCKRQRTNQLPPKYTPGLVANTIHQSPDCHLTFALRSTHEKWMGGWKQRALSDKMNLVTAYQWWALPLFPFLPYILRIGQNEVAILSLRRWNGLYEVA